MSGIHLFGTLVGCPVEALQYSPEVLQRIRSLIDGAGFQRVAEACHEFPNGGYTFVICLAESHVAVHTWIEERRVTLDVFACGIRSDHSVAARRVCDEISAVFAPQRREIREIVR